MDFIEDSPSRLLWCKLQYKVECLLEINLRKRKWVLKCLYMPHRSLTSNQIKLLNRITDKHSKTYGRFICTGDLNVAHDKNSMTNLVNINCIKGLTHYIPVLLFYTPWKHQETSNFSDVFKGYRKATPDCNGLIKEPTCAHKSTKSVSAQ